MNLQKQLRCVYLHAFTSTLRFTDAVWVALLAARGFTLAQIGLAEGVFHGVSLLCEVPSGMAADLLGRRRTLIFGGALGVVSAATMAFAPSLAFICAGMGLKALGYNLLSGTTEALTYDSLKTAGRERDYIKVDAKASIFMKLASALGALASLLAGVLTSAGYYLADAAVSAVSALAAANLTEPVVTDEQAAREKHILQELPARLRVHILDSLDCLCSSTPARRIIMADAVISLPSYLTSMFVQQRLIELGWPTALLFVPMLLSGLASMLGVEAARRLHPESLRRFYAVCALLCGGGCALVGAAPALGCIFGCMLVQGVIDAYLLHEDQKLNDVIPSDQRATLISVDSMVYSLLMIPASPLVGAVGDAFGQAGAGLAVLGVLVALTGAAALYKTR